MNELRAKDASSGDIFTWGERWHQLTRNMTHRFFLSGLSWLRFVSNVKNRYGIAFARQGLLETFQDRQEDEQFDPENRSALSQIPGSILTSQPQKELYPVGQSSDFHVPSNSRVESQRVSHGRSSDHDKDRTDTHVPLLPPSMLHDPSHTLESNVESRLGSVLNMNIPAVKIYTNQAADNIARRFDADAVSYGPHILFRAGKYAPHTPAGLALLGHELTHAAHARMTENPTLTSKELALEETTALNNEHNILSQITPLAMQHSFESYSRNENPPNTQSSVPPPRTAASDRPIDSSDIIDPLAGSILPEQQLRQIKEEVYNDLMDRIRTEFEQGA